MTMTQQQRDRWLDDYRSLHALWRAGGDPSQGISADDAKAQRDAKRLDYFSGLPTVTVSRCPYCDKPVIAQFDPWGLDGFWWQERELGATRAPDACGHFRLLTGALSLQHQPAKGGEHPAHPGPDVPFVVPEVLDQDTAMAVVAALPMHNGYVAYLICYFALDGVNAAASAPTWRRTTCSFTAPDGSSAWTPRVAPWDFDLAPWIARGKLRWIEPKDSQMTLSETGICPYLNLPGKRMNQVVKGDRLRVTDPPTGDVPDPFSL